MGAILSAIKGAIGLGATGQSDTDMGVGTGLDSNLALQYTQDRWTDRKNAYVVYHCSVWQTLLFYANQSWIEWDDVRKIWQPQTPTDEWVPRPRINRYSPTIDAVASNFSQIPEIEATAKPDDDPTANMVSQVCTKLSEWIVVKEALKHQYGTMLDKAGLASQLFVLTGGMFSIIRVKNNKTNVPKKSMQSAYGYTCPNCDKYVVGAPGQEPPQFCPQCGNPITAEETQLMAPEMGDDGQPAMESQDNYDLSLEIAPTINAFPRPGATSIEDSSDLLWANRMPLEAIWYRWNFEAQPDAIWPDGYAVTYEHALNFWYTGYSNTAIQIKDSCMVLEEYVEPGKVKDFPKGFYNVIINDVVAHEEEWEFPEHPVTMGEYLRLPTIFFPRSIGFDLCEIQRELNAYESIIKLHAMTSATDPIMQDINTIVSEITGRSDKIIKYRLISPASQKPERLPSGHLDDGIYKQRDNLHSEFQNISMAVNAFRGQQEGAITAASAIQQLRSQAELMFGKPAANWNSFWCETIRKYVKFIQYYFQVDQIIAIVGPGLDEEVSAFMGADLDKVVDWVTTTHGLPKTRDERRQEMMMLFDKGALDINDPIVKNKIFELFGETGMMASFNLDATNARIENQLFKTGSGMQGQPYQAPKIIPMPLIEDMNVHLQFHKDAAKSRDFQKWQPQAKQSLIQHIMATQDEIDKQQIAGMTKQLTAAAAAASVKGLSKGGPHTQEAMDESGKVQSTVLKSASAMNQNVQGQSPSLATPTPTGSAQ
jgi:hypothetical protein